MRYINNLPGELTHTVRDGEDTCVCGFWDVGSADPETGPTLTTRPMFRILPECRVDDPVAPVSSRKDLPVFSGCLAYFPDALLAVSSLSKFGNDKHNPGQPLHWAKDKSNDHADALTRHLMEHGTIDPDTGLSHTVAVAWRALALLQTEIEQGRDNRASLPVPPATKG